MIAVADDLITTDSGQRIARIVRTGHRSSKMGENLADAASQIAAAAQLPGCTAEIIHLGDDDPTVRVTFDTTGLGKQTEKLLKAFTAIGEGRFEADDSDRTCPFCPAFFTYGPIADGGLQKNF